MTRIDIEKIEKSGIRKYWDENSGQYYFSIVDIIGIISDSSDPRNYWKVLKSRLKNTQKELVTECNQLKMKAGDGKFYLTDTAKVETILQIIKLVSKENVNIFDAWFDQLEREKVQNKLPKTNFHPRDDVSENSQNLTQDESYPQPEAELLVDAYETSDNIFIQSFVAGVKEKDLSISLTCNSVTIRGTRESKNIMSESNNETEELYWGNFSRTISLPEEVDIEKVEATNSQGLLKIKLQKLNKSESKKIEIEFQ